MQLRYVEEVSLKKATKTKQANGTYIDTYTQIADYSIQRQGLTDEVSASIYQADINKITRIKSINSELEQYLKGKVNNNTDNVSKYFIIMDETKYKIISVKEKWVDIQATGEYKEPVSA